MGEQALGFEERRENATGAGTDHNRCGAGVPLRALALPLWEKSSVPLSATKYWLSLSLLQGFLVRFLSIFRQKF